MKRPLDILRAATLAFALSITLSHVAPGTPDSADAARRGSIEDVLGPGIRAELGRMNDGTDLQRHDINLRRFPDALSNDGTGAVFYYRPYDGEENRDKWVIQLKGGGGCSSAALCAERWKSVDTFLGLDHMSTSTAPPTGIDGDGILYRGTEYSNPFANWNQVFLWYSSSDLWTGTGKNVSVRTVYPDVPGDPRAGQPVVFTINFLGHEILNATIATLSGRGRLMYTLNGQETEMPDLDMATEVVFAGGSAGGFGVINNLDRLAGLLTKQNRSCGNRNCTPTIWGIADSSVGPSYSALDFADSNACSGPAQCTYAGHIRHELEQGALRLWRPELDESCLSWHKANARLSKWQCGDYLTHAIEHVTTPIFLRMGQNDAVILRLGYRDLGLSSPGAGLLDQPTFATMVRQRLISFRLALSSPSPLDEGPEMSMAPGVFSPTCSNHETLSSNNVVYTTTITAQGTAYTMFDVIENWRNGTGPANVVTLPGGTEFCP